MLNMHRTSACLCLARSCTLVGNTLHIFSKMMMMMMMMMMIMMMMMMMMANCW